jgi:GNAT superfamily N-acetyltransferase
LVQTRVLVGGDLEAFRRIQSEYLDNWTPVLLREQFSKFPSLHVGSFLKATLVGIAYGTADLEDDSATLQGIAVRFSLWRRGIGSTLLGFFEEQVRGMGIHSVGLGCGEGFAEQFYMKNGYRPVELKAKSVDGRVLAVEPVRDYSDGLLKRERLRRELRPREVIFIMEKHL